MYVANTSVLKLWNFSRRFQLYYEILLPVLNTFTADTEEAFPTSINYRVNDAKALEYLYHHNSFMWGFEIAKHLHIHVDSFNWGLTKSG